MSTQTLVQQFKVITRPVRLYYPILLKLGMIRLICLLIPSARVAKTAARILLPKSDRMKIFVYPHSLRMKAAQTFAKIRSLSHPMPPVTTEAAQAAQQIRVDGHSNRIDVGFSDQDCARVVNFFENQRSILGHGYTRDAKIDYAPTLKVMRAEGRKLPRYLSYDIETQFQCPELFKLATHPKVVEIASAFFGCLPRLEFINTFWNLPSDEASWLADYHRDFDDYQCLTFFVNWTDTSINLAGTEYIKRTHRPSAELSKKLLQANDESTHGSNLSTLSDAQIFDRFRESTFPGYKQNPRYDRIFTASDKLILSGKPGSVYCADNEGLHRGPQVSDVRLVSWLRYGASGGHQDRSIEALSVPLTDSQKAVLRGNPHARVLDEIFPELS